MNPADFMRSPFFLNNKWVQVSNQSGDTIPPFSVVRAGEPATGNNNFGFPIAQPNSSSTAFDRDYLVTGPYAIGFGTGAEFIATDLASFGLVRHDGSATPTKNQVWGPKHGQYTLANLYYGFSCQGGSFTACGNSVSVFKQTGYNILYGKVDDTNVNKNASATVSVWTGDRSGDTGMNVESTNRSINLTGVNGKMCIVVAAGAFAEFVMVECS